MFVELNIPEDFDPSKVSKPDGCKDFQINYVLSNSLALVFLRLLENNFPSAPDLSGIKPVRVNDYYYNDTYYYDGFAHKDSVRRENMYRLLDDYKKISSYNLSVQFHNKIVSDVFAKYQGIDINNKFSDADKFAEIEKYLILMRYVKKKTSKKPEMIVTLYEINSTNHSVAHRDVTIYGEKSDFSYTPYPPSFDLEKYYSRCEELAAKYIKTLTANRSARLNQIKDKSLENKEAKNNIPAKPKSTDTAGTIYTIDNDVASVIKCGVKDGIISIPAQILFRDTKCNVLSIEHDAFKECKDVEEIKLSRNIKSFDLTEVKSISSLRKITLHSNIEKLSIGNDLPAGITFKVIGNDFVAEGSYSAFLKAFVSKFRDLSAFDGVVYKISEGKASLVMLPDEPNIRIPDSIKANGKDIPVTDINLESSPNKNVLKEIWLGENVEVINSNCFAGCQNLTYVGFNKKLRHIGQKAFSGCYNIKKIDLPESIEFIGEHAFESCLSLENIVIPSSVKTVESNILKMCSLCGVTITGNNDISRWDINWNKGELSVVRER